MIRMKVNNEVIDKFTILILVAAPFLNVYATPIPSVGICDLCLLILLVYYFLHGIRYEIKPSLICRYKLATAGFIVGNYLAVMLFTGFYMWGSVTLRTLRYLVYILIGVLFSVSHERRKDAIRYFEFFSVLGTGLIILQNVVFRFAGYYITGIIPFMRLMNDAGFKEQIYNIYHMGGRPYSFFSEPSTYGMYVGLCLALELFVKEESAANFFVRWFLTLGLILSGSTTGLASVLILYGILFIKRILHKNLKFQARDVAFVVTLLPALAIVLLKSSTVQSMIARLQNGGSVMDRFAGYKVFSLPMNFMEMLIGHGMNDNIEEYFMAGIPRLYYYWGILGFVFIAISVWYIFQRVDRVSRIVILFVAFMNIATVWFWGQYTLLTFALLAERTEEEGKE